MASLSFTDLNVYKECRFLRKEISLLVKSHFPNTEKYKLTDQIIRSSRSITANLSEGYGRYYYKENIQFCRISRGSLSETLEHLITAFDEGYISQDQLYSFKLQIENCGKLLNGYINYLKKVANPPDES
ncbi:four helix bundle protein [Lacihabitans sp. LS3-19]|uniref:four helix bundle protein n=1 Tax=Lacihabitans sp. LS3-19 TaxID=2487335 RepID=UPI0020CDAA5A|nr:four helix bundle protein [Lacihabitans sp. LS3-19]MCP9770449.1 four helix bundle protein [Lacihabitans sp. LS3-19]